MAGARHEQMRYKLVTSYMYNKNYRESDEVEEFSPPAPYALNERKKIFMGYTRGFCLAIEPKSLYNRNWEIIHEEEFTCAIVSFQLYVRLL